MLSLDLATKSRALSPSSFLLIHYIYGIIDVFVDVFIRIWPSVFSQVGFFDAQSVDVEYFDVQSFDVQSFDFVHFDV